MNRTWLFSKSTDLAVLFAPVWLTWCICFYLPPKVMACDLPLWAWAIIILGIDVSHVWSSIFRTYLDKDTFSNHKRTLVISPIICFASIFIINLLYPEIFWRLLAYLALFHFIKQQVGFLSFYRAKHKEKSSLSILSDKRVIYFSMLYPVFYWHMNNDIVFSWFAQNDFINLSTFINISDYFTYLNIIYWFILLFWLVQSLLLASKNESTIPVGKLLWVITTGCNWYIGIVYFNSDIAFSLTNVVAHGVPYMALIFIYRWRNDQFKNNTTRSFTLLGLKMILTIGFLAFIEEYLWDILVNKNKSSFFESILPYQIQDIHSNTLMAFIIAILSVPQVTHYILDAYIWKGNHKNKSVRTLIIEH